MFKLLQLDSIYTLGKANRSSLLGCVARQSPMAVFPSCPVLCLYLVQFYMLYRPCLLHPKAFIPVYVRHQGIRNIVLRLSGFAVVCLPSLGSQPLEVSGVST